MRVLIDRRGICDLKVRRGIVEKLTERFIQDFSVKYREVLSCPRLPYEQRLVFWDFSASLAWPGAIEHFRQELRSFEVDLLLWLRSDCEHLPRMAAKSITHL